MDLIAFTTLALAIIVLGATGSYGKQTDEWNRQSHDFSTVGHNGFQSSGDSNRYPGNQAFSSNYDSNNDGANRPGGLTGGYNNANGASQADGFSTVGYNGFQSTENPNEYQGTQAFSSSQGGYNDGSKRPGSLNGGYNNANGVLNVGGSGRFQGNNDQYNGRGQSNYDTNGRATIGGGRQNQGFSDDNGRQNQGSYDSNGRQDQYFGQGDLEALRIVIPGWGIPGQDYPILASVPITGFKCSDHGPGQFADSQPESRCQAFYTCQADGRMDSFLCPNGTIYDQKTRTCDWWFNVDCGSNRAIGINGRYNDAGGFSTVGNNGFQSTVDSNKYQGNQAFSTNRGGNNDNSDRSGGFNDVRQTDDFSTVEYNGFQTTVDSNRYLGKQAIRSNFEGDGDGSYRSGGLNGGGRQNQGFPDGNGDQNQGSYQSNGRQDQYFEQGALEALRVAIPGGGIPGRDYPILASVPITGFKCSDYGSGQFADPQQESRCQAFYTCQADGRMDSFLCPNGTIYNQKIRTCDWWFNVECRSPDQFNDRNNENERTNSGQTNGGQFSQNLGFTQRTNNGFEGNDSGSIHSSYLTTTNSYSTHSNPNFNRVQNN